MPKILPPSLFLFSIIMMIALRWGWPLYQWVFFPYNLIGLIPLAVGIGLTIQGSRLFEQVGTNIKTFNEPNHFCHKWAFCTEQKSNVPRHSDGSSGYVNRFRNNIGIANHCLIFRCG